MNLESMNELDVMPDNNNEVLETIKNDEWFAERRTRVECLVILIDPDDLLN